MPNFSSLACLERLSRVVMVVGWGGGGGGEKLEIRLSSAQLLLGLRLSLASCSEIYTMLYPCCCYYCPNSNSFMIQPPWPPEFNQETSIGGSSPLAVPKAPGW